MIIGARNYLRTEFYYAQARKDAMGNIIPNSAFEEVLYKDDIQDMGKTNRNLWLETCGNHAASNADVSRLKDPIGWEKLLKEEYDLRMPDIMTCWANTPQNYPILKQARPNLDPHIYNASEIAQYHPFLIEYLFKHKAEFRPSLDWQGAIRLIQDGSALVKCLINPGHFIALVAFDDIKQEFIALDSRAYIDDNWNSRYDKIDYTTNMYVFASIYPPEI
jgi:hypothetical protein